MTPEKIYFENLAETIIEKLGKRNMEGYYCETKAMAVEQALSLMPEGSSIAWGGSESIEECGLMEALHDGNYELYDRSTAKTAQEKKDIYIQSAGADFFLMSTGAITIEGELVNIDGAGNRVACLCFGPSHVIVIAGMNKVVTDIDSGLKRVRNTAAPKNTVRLKKSTPCAKVGKCCDCFSPDCICSQFVVTRRSGIPGRIQVILVGENLGY